MLITSPIIEYKKAVGFEGIQELAEQGYKITPMKDPIALEDGKSVWLMQRWTGKDFDINEDRRNEADQRELIIQRVLDIGLIEMKKWMIINGGYGLSIVESEIIKQRIEERIREALK